MEGILKNLSGYISNPRNVYGFSFFSSSIRDSTMLSSRFISAAYPTNTELYSYIDMIVKNIKKQKGEVSGKPLFNVEKQSNGSFETQVAIPTLHALKNDGNIVFRRMVPGTFLCTEVYGGAKTAEEALRQMYFFISDNHKSKQANAFQILLTDRRSEPDTLKWLTKIYIPVGNSDLPPKQ
jgi:effector-binding domain-containing protein